MSRTRELAAGTVLSAGRSRRGRPAVAPLGAPHGRAASSAPGRVQPHWTHRALAEHLREGLFAAAGQHAKFGAHVLAGMSDQASMLGHPHEALQLATAGRHGLARDYSLACAADLWALQARAHEALGESRNDEPEWARFIDTAYLAGEWTNACGDIAQPVESTRFARRSAAETRNQKRARIQPFHTVTVARDFDERVRLALAISHQA